MNVFEELEKLFKDIDSLNIPEGYSSKKDTKAWLRKRIQYILDDFTEEEIVEGKLVEEFTEYFNKHK